VRLAVSGASFAYRPGHPVFEGLALEVAEGEAVCLLGPNGCGKTTLLKCCTGLLRPVHGSVRIDGEDIHGLDRRAAARRVGFVPQSHDVVFPYSVQDVVLMGRTPHLSPWGTPSAADHDLARQAIEEVGLGAKAAEAYSTLSGGERQLALVARALCQAPALLLMDEPVAHLDLRNQATVLALVGKLVDRGLSVLFTSHDPVHASRAAGRVALMHADGRLRVGPPAAIVTCASLGEAYGIPVEQVRALGDRFVARTDPGGGGPAPATAS
jgi:iron complex transport system ATP-binding protein